MRLLSHCLVVTMGEGSLLCHYCHHRIEMKRIWAWRGVAEKSRKCSFCLVDYWGKESIGGYYEEWWAGVGRLLRCKVLHLVPHWAVKRWRPNRWWNSPSETLHSMSILTQVKIQTVWESMHLLISSTCSVHTELKKLKKYPWNCSNELFYYFVWQMSRGRDLVISGAPGKSWLALISPFFVMANVCIGIDRRSTELLIIRLWILHSKSSAFRKSNIISIMYLNLLCSRWSL